MDPEALRFLADVTERSNYMQWIALFRHILKDRLDTPEQVSEDLAHGRSFRIMLARQTPDLAASPTS